MYFPGCIWIPASQDAFPWPLTFETGIQSSCRHRSCCVRGTGQFVGSTALWLLEQWRMIQCSSGRPVQKKVENIFWNDWKIILTQLLFKWLPFDDFSWYWIEKACLFQIWLGCIGGETLTHLYRDCMFILGNPYPFHSTTNSKTVPCRNGNPWKERGFRRRDASKNTSAERRGRMMMMMTRWWERKYLLFGPSFGGIWMDETLSDNNIHRVELGLLASTILFMNICNISNYRFKKKTKWMKK